MINTNEIKKDFPIFNRKINGKELVYLDNAATTQKPKEVVDAIADFYFNHNANVKRGSYTLGDEATDLFEKSRGIVAEFIGAATPKEIIFTKNSTESLNIVAFSWGLNNIVEGDEILTTVAEHNSSLLPWMEVANRKNAKIVYVEANEKGEVSAKDFETKMSERSKVIVISHASNVLGSILPVKEICSVAKKFGTVVCVDGSQAAPNMLVNVKSLGCDFYAFSGHKMLGPMGVGILWGKRELLEFMPPVFMGGGMIKSFNDSNHDWFEIPDRFEAGTPNVADAVGFGIALNYLNKIGMENIREHEIALNGYLINKLLETPQINILGPLNPTKRVGLTSFTIKGIHPHDISAVLNTEGIAVRSGMHCAMKLHKDLNIPASTRVSYYIYNSTEDIDKLVRGIYRALDILRK